MSAVAPAWSPTEEQARSSRLWRFMQAQGCASYPELCRKAAAEPRFLTAILDYLASNEALLIDFARDSGRTPEQAARAHAALRGPESEADP